MTETKMIDDGYNFTRPIPRIAFVEGPVSFTYRPAVGAAHRTFSRALMGGASESTAVGAGIIAASVKEWNLRWHKGRVSTTAGEAIPITAEEAAKLPSNLFTEILDAVFGFEKEAETAKN